MSEIEQAQREAVLAEARTWIGTPYHHQGRIKKVGVDCATILLEVFSRCGLAENAFPEYSPTWHLHRGEEVYLCWMARYTREITEAELQPGDIVVFKWGRCFSHGSIYIGNGEVLHSYIGIGCIISNMSEGLFEGRDRRYFSVWGK